jgi:hypothetical protein
MHTPGFNAHTHVALAVGLLVASIIVCAVSRRGWPAPVGILLILTFHPAWTIEPGQERDFSKRQMGTAASAVAATIAVTQGVWFGWIFLRRPATGCQVDDYGEQGTGPDIA